MVELSKWPYIHKISVTGDLKEDITCLLTANGKHDTLRHCFSVVETSQRIADQFGLDKDILSTSSLLHDVSNVVNPADMLDYATSRNWDIDSAEMKYPFLLHQRLSATFAANLFGINNPIILSAIECHTTLKENPSDYDMALFLADKLSWDQDGNLPFFDVVSLAMENSLSSAALVYINFVLDNGLILSPHKWLLNARKWLVSLS